MMTNATMKLLLICVCIIANYQYAASMTREDYLYHKYGELRPEYQEDNELIKEYPLPAPKIVKCRSRYNKNHIKQKKQLLIPYENLKRVETTKSPYEEKIKYIDNPKYNKPLLHEILTTKSKEPNTDVDYKTPKDQKHLDKYGYILKELAHLPREESVSTLKIPNTHNQNVNNNLLNDPKTKWVVVKAEGQKAHAKQELDNSESPIIRLDDTKGGKTILNVKKTGFALNCYVTEPATELKTKPHVFDGIIVGDKKVFKTNKDVKYKIPKDQNHLDKRGSILKKLAHLPREESSATMKISDIYDQNENNDPQTKWIVVKAEGQKAHARLELDNSSPKKDTKYKAEDNEPVNVESHDSESPVFRLHETKGDPATELKTKPDVFDGIIVGEPDPPTRDNQHMYNAIIVGAEHEEENEPSIFTLFK